MKTLPFYSFVRLLLCLLVSYLVGLHAVVPVCPNDCNGNGFCSNGPQGYCLCFAGYIGVDCSLRTCPSAKAFVDFPSANNVAHADYTECSNMGLCDRTTGTCNCRFGFSGPACEKMLCQLGSSVINAAGTLNAICSGNGRCMTLRQLAQYTDYSTYVNTTYPYTDWDADRISGCVCDPGYEGVACAQRSCPKGDNPSTVGVDTIQLIDCTCTACTGGIKLSFKGHLTNLIPYDATAELIKYRLEELSTLNSVEVNIIQGNHICSSSGSVTQVVFKLPQGPQPALIITAVNNLIGSVSVHINGVASSINSIFKSVIGTKEFEECSGRGSCDYSSGTCICYNGYGSSNGRGQPGRKGDCGYTPSVDFSQVVIVSTTLTLTSKCPYVTGGLCAGNGVCSEVSGLCTCNAGFGGFACVNRTCLNTPTFFGKLGVLGHVETNSVCGGVGVCNGLTGTCSNCGGIYGLFTGDRCETMTCASTATGGVCSSHGACLTLRELASQAYTEQKQLSNVVYTTPWDADMIRGCACLRAVTIDKQFNQSLFNEFKQIICDKNNLDSTTCINPLVLLTNEQIYRGPYSYAVTDFAAYNCAHSNCPNGDDPRLYTGFNQIQRLNCKAKNGSFILNFRENSTVPIQYNETAYRLQLILNEVLTIREVKVTINNPSDSVCNENGDLNVFIEFLTEFGNLPLLRYDTTKLPHSLFNISEYQTSTKKEIECSGTGICNELTGVCNCVPPYYSSEGSNRGPGSTGDCTYYNPLYTESPLFKNLIS